MIEDTAVALPVTVRMDPEVVLYAVRYCLGRQSYAAADGARLARAHAAGLPDGLRAALVRDMTDHRRDGRSAALGAARLAAGQATRPVRG